MFRTSQYEFYFSSQLKAGENGVRGHNTYGFVKQIGPDSHLQ